MSITEINRVIIACFAFLPIRTFVVAVPARLKSSIRPLGNGPIPVPTRQRHSVRKISIVSLTSIQQSLNVFLLTSRLTTRRQLSRLADLWTRMPSTVRASHLLQADTPAGYRNRGEHNGSHDDPRRSETALGCN